MMLLVSNDIFDEGAFSEKDIDVFIGLTKSFSKQDMGKKNGRFHY